MSKAAEPLKAQVTFKLDAEMLADLDRMAEARSRAEDRTGREAYSRNTIARQLVVDAVARHRAGEPEAAPLMPPPARPDLPPETLETILRAVEELSATTALHVSKQTGEQLDRFGEELFALRRSVASVMLGFLKAGGMEADKAEELVLKNLHIKPSGG
jgi:predicted transcriptional regulator